MLCETLNRRAESACIAVLSARAFSASRLWRAPLNHLIGVRLGQGIVGEPAGRAVIEQAIRMLLDGSIIRRHYDARAGEIVAKD